MNLEIQIEPVMENSKTPKIFSVTEVSAALKKHVESTFSNIYVRGEIAGLKIHTSGHAYYTLKDQDSVIDAVCWRGTLSGKGLKLEEGLEIIAKGRLTIYPGRSKYQLIVEDFKPAGQGALLQLLQKRKETLQAEGLFDKTRKKPLPLFPKTIGLITSATGAVIRDILHRLGDRYPCEVLLWPVAVQGETAANQITQAIEGFNALDLDKRPDLLIVARGGGSLEDLMAFNEEVVVRAAANSQIPLISAVGHETDTTLIDYAADLRAPTPTAAAELATPVRAELLAYLNERSKHLYRLLSQDLYQKSLKLKALEKGIIHPGRLLEDLMLKVDDKAETLKQLVCLQQERLGHKLSHLSLRLKFPQNWMQEQQKKVDSLGVFLKMHEKELLQKYTYDLSLLAQRLEGASYEKVLKRGFCLTKSENGLVSSKEQAQILDKFSVVFYDGDLEVKPL